MSGPRTAYRFNILLCLKFIVASAFATASSFPKPPPEIPRIVFIYDQPLKSEDIPLITSLLNRHQYSEDISTERFAPGTSVWIYVPESTLRNNTARKILVTGYQDYIDVYAIRSGDWVKLRTGGKYVPSSKLDSTVGREFVTLYDSLAGISKGGYLIACRKFNNFNYSPLLASLKSEEELTSWQLEFRISAEKYPKFIFPFVGVLLTTVLHLLVLFFLSKNWSYTYHAIGLLLTLSFFTFCYFQYPINVNDSPFDDPKTLINFDCFVLFLALACNFMSVRGFYDTGKLVQLNNRITARLACVAVVVAVASLIFSILTNLYYLVNYIAIALEPVISGIYAIYLIKIRKEIKNAFRIYIFGLCILTVFLEAAFLLSLLASNNSLGIGSEVLLIFPMILGISIFNGFIITAVITRNYQTRLESASLRARATEAEMAAVQRGMSPHFIFNCLNLIDYFLYKNETTAARNVLFDFSDLLRLVIDKSPKQLIQLSEELKILELYMNLEKSRSDNSFRYTVTISPHLDIELFLVPPLIVQPIVENAIKHGILNRKQAGGQIDISISRKNDELLEIKVEDNGAGRRIAKLLQQGSYRQVGHVGISHTEKRLEIISEVFGTDSYLKIIDKPNDYEGTIVKMYLPLLQSKTNEDVLRKVSDIYM
ncbi:sensor histidine kinase [Dyadobacter sp. CY312]|uniref:sensor histidine kinase n=1 Tax=Dyadobacter sp. CY312 TaxID=2907303 RepID=UPI001F1C1352|nr:histidine kinase [Dyadobacter sp. CY312]MCE7040433.1 histidine kinase [Dyadobacter sp. CY312]